MKNFILLFGLYGMIGFAFAQSIPDIGNDPHWVLNSNMSDEFNSGTTFDNTKWTWTPGYHPLWPDNEYGTYSDGACYDNSLNVIAVATESSTSFMRLSVKNLNTSCEDTEGNTYNMPYAMGALIGLQQQQYGYFTIRFRSSWPSEWPSENHQGISANAWLWRSHDPFNNIWSEIDLCEMNCFNNHHTSNVHYDPSEDAPNPWPTSFPHVDGNGSPCLMTSSGIAYPNGTWTSFSHYTSPGNHISPVTGWHTYSAVWFPNGIAIYFDGKRINETMIGCPGMEEMNWIIGPGSALGQFGSGIGSNTLLPYHMDVDYARTYYLNTNCDDQVINQPSYNVNTYDGNHKKSITFGGGGYSTSVTTGTSIYMKATDFIQINGTFTVPVGATYVADVLPCM